MGEATYANGAVYIVMEYARKGNLKQMISKYATGSGALPESMVRKYFVQLALAMKALHDANILHRDLKSDNVFLDEEMNVKLGDFGLARNMYDSRYVYIFVGTPGYQAPEISMGRAYDAKADVWSVGCIVYEMCTGRTPIHPSMNKQAMYMTPSALPYTYSSGLRTLVVKLLSKSPSSRPSMADLLQEPYLQNAFEKDLSDAQKAVFDANLNYVGPTVHDDVTHADDIQRHLIGSVRVFDFADVDAQKSSSTSSTATTSTATTTTQSTTTSVAEAANLKENASSTKGGYKLNTGRPSGTGTPVKILRPSSRPGSSFGSSYIGALGSPPSDSGSDSDV